jgi:hypothetical protein
VSVATLSPVTRIRSARLGAVLLAGAGALLTGCSGGFDAQARQVYAPADGAQADAGSVRISNALVVAPAGGTEGVLLMTVSNRGGKTQQLTSLTSNGGTVDYTGSRRLAAGQAVSFSAVTDPSATITNLRLKPGENITLRFGFSGEDPVTVRTLVVPATGIYSTVTPAATPTVEPSSSVSSTTGSSGTGTPTGTSTSRAPIASPSSS